MINRFHLSDVNPLRGLRESQLVGLLDEGERGAYAYLQWLYRFVEKRNPTARAVKRRLMSALGKLQWKIKTRDCGDDQAKQLKADAQAATLRAAYDQVKQLRRALNHLATGELRGFAHVEKIYAGPATPDPWAIVELRPVEQWFWVRDGLYGAWEYNADAKVGAYRGTAVDRAQFIVHEVDDPADEIIAKLHVRQEASDADWDGYLEDFGVPSVFITGPPNVPPEKEAEYKRAAEQITGASRGYLPNGATVDIGTASTGSSVFMERLEYLDGQIVIAGTAGKLTILAESGSGTLAGGAQKDAFDDIAEAIAMNINQAMNDDFDAEILERVHPGEECLAYFEFAAVSEKDGSKALVDAKAAKEAGFAMDADELSEVSGYKLKPILETPPDRPPTKAEVVPGTAPSKPDVAPGAVAEGVPAVEIRDATAKALKVTPEFVAPAQSVFDALLEKAEDGAVTDDELMASADELLAALPDLARQSDVSGVADAMQAAMKQAMEKTLGQ